MIVVGGGGQAGSVTSHDNYIKYRRPLLPRGYAFVGHDSGHSRAGVKWSWHNLQATVDYGFRGAHVSTLIGKAVLRAYYGRLPDYSYYDGCSNGGREALMMAQRYPYDFDGIIAGAPSMDFSKLFLRALHFLDVLQDRSRSGFDDIAASVLHKSVMRQCDTLDGKQDGIIDDPGSCKVDFERVRCRHEARDDCLTARQINSARQIYEGPRNPNGDVIAPSSAMPGSELTWSSWLTLGNYPADVLRYQAFDPAPGPDWTPDLKRLGDYARRMGLMNALISATNPDLRPFKASGGKLLSYFGWNDSMGGIRETLDYYGSVERLMGGPEHTLDFYRLFLVPGMNHCDGGVGAFSFDYVEALDRWVTKGQAPAKLVGSRLNQDGTAELRREVRPYTTPARRADRSR